MNKLECTCIDAYKIRNMRDPNCCACSCDYNDLAEQLAKANERVSDLESKLEAVTQEARVQASELDTQKGIVQSVQDKFNLRVYDFNISKALDIALSKFAIEQQVKGALEFAGYLDCSNFSAAIAAKESGFFQLVESFSQQLRKEQE